MKDLEATEENEAQKIEMYEIANRLKSCKKPKSLVKGDIPPGLILENADLLAIPLHSVFNKAIKQGVWPELWQLETVTVIPKNAAPSKLGELRNLSCTPLFSKVLEHFVLQDLKSKVKLSEAQFGGVKGVSTDHFLISLWQRILEHLESKETAANILSVDFEKAFNRMNHYECLNALSIMGACK